jgi:hypothetical protein
LHFGEIAEGRIESVKERDYDIKDFIGPAKIETKVFGASFTLLDSLIVVQKSKNFFL